MLIAVHVSFALMSIVFALFAYLSPSKNKQFISRLMIAATLISGSLLIVITHANMVSSCESGLLYLATVGTLQVLAQKRLKQRFRTQPLV